MFSCDERPVLVADSAALASTRLAQHMDDHSLSVGIGSGKYGIIRVSMLFWSAHLPQLRACRPAIWTRSIERSDRSRSIHVGLQLYSVPHSSDLPNGSILGKRRTYGCKDRIGENTCDGSVDQSNSSAGWGFSVCGFSLIG